MNRYKLNNEHFYTQLEILVKSCPRSYFNSLRTDKFKDIFQWIIKQTPLLDDPKFKLSTRCNWILNDIHGFPKCSVCGCEFGKNINLQIHSHYSSTCPKCSRKIAGQHAKASAQARLAENPRYYQQIASKRKQTCLKLHNDPNWNNIEKCKQTCLESYGVDNVRKSKECKVKIKQSKLEKHGDENYSNIEQFKSTCLKNYGVEWPMQCPDIRAKAASKYMFDGLQFDSKQELCFYIWLKDSKIEFTYKPSMKISYMHNGIEHFYFPDFIVNGQTVEVKGSHFFKEDGTMCNPYDHSQDGLYEAKHQCMLANNVKIIKQDECKTYIDYVNETYGKHFLKNCKATFSSC